MKEFYNSPVAKVYYDVELNIFVLEYISKVLNDEQFIDINTKVLKAFLLLDTQKFVVDISKIGMIGVASQQWVVSTLLP